MCEYCNDLIPWMGFGNWIPLRSARQGGCCDFYVASIKEWYSSFGEGKWRENRHGDRKSRLIAELRDLWQVSPGDDILEQLVAEIHTVAYSQMAIRHDRYRQTRRFRWKRKTGDNTTQERLTYKY